MSPGLGVRHIYSARARRGRGQGTILKTPGTETGGRHVIKSRAPLGGGFIMMSPLSHSVTSHCAFVLLYFVALISGTSGDCPSPPRLQYAELKAAFVSQTIFLPGSSVEYTCRPGYIRVPGAKTAITCLASSTWTAAEVFCARRSCGSPGAIDNGDFDVPDLLLGSRATYFCNDGFRLLSKRNYRDCQPDGTWSNAVPACEAVICPPPDAITDGTYSPRKEEYAYLDAVTYACNLKNLALVGKSSLFCTKHGTWSAEVPKCQAVECLNPNVPNSRRLSGFQGPYRLNSAISFECVEGFTMSGSSVITCRLNNEWEPPLPECLISFHSSSDGESSNQNRNHGPRIFWGLPSSEKVDKINQDPAFTNKPTKGGEASAPTGSNTGLIIGGVCGVIVFLLLIAVGVCWYLRTRGKREPDPYNAHYTTCDA
ncbi:membrane cofactor protein-like isoform X3 [Ascaphus truei]|uniref:membrane cofactor protein-like isoform X3 n=1 Tax=Ascaphus truei TaxID=8439 RepID=UPI003F596229